MREGGSVARPALAARIVTLLGRPGRARSAAIWAGVAVAALAAAPLVSPSNDDLYALAWGGELWRGRLPQIDGPLVPAAHPLNILASAALAPLGPSGARYAFCALSLVALAVLFYAAFRLGRRIGGIAVGLLAALLVATRPQVEIWGWAAVADIPFVALALLAVALAAEAPERNRWKALGLLVAAGLLRPEAWALSVVYGGWLVTREGTLRARAAIVALALAAPLLWGAFDLVVAGDPLFAVTTAGDIELDELEAADFRARGPLELEPSGLARLGDALPHVIGWPLLAVGTVAALVALDGLRRRPGPGNSTAWTESVIAAIALGGCSVFVALNLARLPAHPRYLLLPGVALVVLAAGAVRWARASRPVAWALAVALAALLALLPSDIAYVNRNLDEENVRFAAAEKAEDAVSGEYATSVLSVCPRLVVGGARRRLAHAGRAAAAAALRRDPAEVAFKRIPRTPPRTSAIFYRSYSGARSGTWRFASACSGLLQVPPAAVRVADAAARVVREELRSARE